MVPSLAQSFTLPLLVDSRKRKIERECETERERERHTHTHKETLDLVTYTVDILGP